MRNVKFNADVVKEMRRLVRNSNQGDAFRAALTKIYQTGYDNGADAAYKDARQKLLEAAKHDNQGPSNGDNDDGERV